MLKLFISCAIAVATLLPFGTKAEDYDPLDMFGVIAADDIKQNERLFRETAGGLNLLGVNILRSSFASNCNKMTSIKYLAELSSFKELDPDRKSFANPAVVRYDNMVDHLAEFLFKVGKQVSTQEFKEAKDGMTYFTIGGDLQAAATTIKNYVERQKKYRDIAAQMRKDFEEIASQKGAPTPKLLSESNKMKKYFQKNPKMWPLKKNNMRTMNIPEIYGMTDYYNQDMSLNTKGRDDAKALDDLVVNLRKSPKYIAYLEQTYSTWKSFLAKGPQYCDKVSQIAEHPRAKAYFVPEFTRALTESVQMHRQLFEGFHRQLESIGIPEVQKAKQFISQEPVASFAKNSGSYQQIWAQGTANTILSTFEMLQPWAEGYLCGKACK
ncbi:MAG: hypothetical protein J5855_10445 [Mailhella sp.]|nr:hypothetical protein [Mailhella sp.]